MSGWFCSGGGAHVAFPLTSDYQWAVDYIRTLTLDDGRRAGADAPEECLNGCTIPGHQTNLGDALAQAFLRVRGPDATTGDRSIVLITDGDDNGSAMSPTIVAKHVHAWSKGAIPIHTFLLGGGEHTAIPVVDRRTGHIRRTAAGRIQYQSAQGRYAANPEAPKLIAKTTGGQSFRSHGAGLLRKHFEQLEAAAYASASPAPTSSGAPRRDPAATLMDRRLNRYARNPANLHARRLRAKRRHLPPPARDW